MELRAPRISAPAWVAKPLEWLGIGLLAPVFLPLIGIVMLGDWLERRIGTAWHPYFAWWPTRCDQWPDGFVGTVWLETIERRREVYPRWGIAYRRLTTSAEPGPGAERVHDRSVHDEPPPPGDGVEGNRSAVARVDMTPDGASASSTEVGRGQS